MFSRPLVHAPLRLILIFSIVGLSACGFHLRGGGGSPEISGPVYVTSKTFSQVASDLRRFLKDNDILLSENPEGAVLQVDIKSEHTRRRTLTIGTDTDVREIELTYLINLTVQRTGDEEAEPERLLVTRDYQFDITGILGVSDEEEILFNEMRRDLVRRVLGRLVSLSRDDAV
jgi:LPS-assembly lipoprotein